MEQENRDFFCKFCQREFKSVLKHLARSEDCKQKYTKEDYENLKTQSSSRREKYRKEYYSNKSTELKEKQANYDKQNRVLKRKRQAVYNHEHSDEIRKKQRKYNNENKNEIAAKQSVYDRQHTEQICQKQARYDKENSVLIRKKLSLKRKLVSANHSSSNRILAFKKAVIEGPNFVCKSCRRKLFKQSVKILSKDDCKNIIKTLDKSLLKRLRINSLILEMQTVFCHNCLKYIKKNKLPNIHFSNGLQLDKVPPELKNLKELEHQLISRSLIFMKLKKLPRSRMRAVTDRVKGVPQGFLSDCLQALFCFA